MKTLRQQLDSILERRILLLDGAMGSLLQARGLGEDDYRGERLRQHPGRLQGNHDLLSLTRPDVVAAAHGAYLEAGADIVETNTFNANPVSQADYGTVPLVREMNAAAARLARQACAEWSARTPQRPRFVAGAIGPTNKTLSLSPRVEDPAWRDLGFDELRQAYAVQVRGLLDGGADLLLVETIFDTLNAKAAIAAVREVLEERGEEVPLMLSVTITDRSGRTLSGQTLEAFWISVEHARPFAVGLNCALGAREMRPHLEELAALADCRVLCYPNAGLPDAFGEYHERPEETARLLRAWAEEGLVDLLGGCCGTTPAHIAALDRALSGLAPRRRPPDRPRLSRWAGLEPLVLRPDSNFLVIGERTNVTGSRRFARLVREGDFEAAVAVARQQVRGGANILDVCMDDALLDGVEAMTRFLRLLAAEPEVARLPVMVDSSRPEVLEAGIRCLQGKGIANSLSLKDGPEAFLERARRLHGLGAALVVMAFDEQGQADSAARRIAVLHRAWRLLLEEAGVPSEDIILDPNVLAVGTGIPEHERYAVDFLEAVRVLKRRCPGARISGGISNLSFAFRGQDRVREAMHASFLYHAIAAGLDMGIVNAGQLAVYDDLDPELRERVEDLLFARHPDATSSLVNWARSHLAGAGRAAEPESDEAWRAAPVAQRLRHALVHGIQDHVEEDSAAALAEAASALAVIEGPLMDGMKEVGRLFGDGRMFLPQVVQSARVMKKAVAFLTPHLEDAAGEAAHGRGRVLLATVKGDVHDIGKNIVGVVLQCNGYEVRDLGVMVPADRILREAQEWSADLVGLSGLITPSLDEMVHVAAEMDRRGLAQPLLIGGATTSRQHTAVRIAPARAGAVLHVPDASRAPEVVAALLDPARRAACAAENAAEQEVLRRRHEARRSPPLLTLAEARARRPRLEWDAPSAPPPAFLGRRLLPELPLAELEELIDWSFFFKAWELPGRWPAVLEHPQHGPAARALHADALALLEEIRADGLLRPRAVYGFWPARSEGDDLLFLDPARPERVLARFPMLRQQRDHPDGRPDLCLADWVAPAESGLRDHAGAFAVSAGPEVETLAAAAEAAHDDYRAILLKALGDRLAEAAATWLHARARQEWGAGGREEAGALLRESHSGIRPAFGYPACPDHSEKRRLFELLDAAEAGLSLTSSGAMVPAASVSGLFLAHPEARYFSLGRLARDQVEDYARRQGISPEEAERRLRPHLGYEPDPSS